MKNPKEIGELLRDIRQKKGLTQEKVYKSAHIQPRIIEALEAGTLYESLGKIYAPLFLKRYAAFLNLDGEGLLKDYKAFYAGKDNRPTPISKREPETYLAIDLRKWMTLAVSTLLALLLIFFILLLGARFKSFLINKKTKGATAHTQTVGAQPKETSQGKTEAIFPIAADRLIVLAVKSSDNVWMKVTKDGKVIFEGTLVKGTEKVWQADSSIDLWAGKAEALDFTINGKPVQKIGKGSIKNIQLSRTGLKVKDKWLLRGTK